MKKIYKYPTGAGIPKGAVYLGTVTQTKIASEESNNVGNFCIVYKDCWYVWHYFLVEVKENE